MAHQTFTYTAGGIGWGSTSNHVSLANGALGGTTAGTFGNEFIAVPMPCDGTFRNLTVFTSYSHPLEFTAGLVVNGILSSLTCVFPAQPIAAEITVSNTASAVSVEMGDMVYMRLYSGPNLGAAGQMIVSFAIEFEGEDGKQFFTLNALNGVKIGGALGSGSPQDSIDPPSTSNTRSYCPTPGTITRVYAKKTYPATIGENIYEFSIVKNSVKELSTVTTITGDDPFSYVDCDLHCDYLDTVDIFCRKLSGASPQNLFGVGIVWEPDDPEVISFCGGNNISVGNFNWITGIQNGSIESEQKSVVSIRGFTIERGWVIRGGPTTEANNGEHTLRKNGEDTEISIFIHGVVKSDSSSGEVVYEGGDFIDWGMVYGAGAALGQMHWSISGRIVTPLVLGGIYKIIPGSRKSNDTIYLDEGGTEDVKIPNPFIKTGLIGN